jgi:GNAT superfamily N-acetyltransferase
VAGHPWTSPPGHRGRGGGHGSHRLGQPQRLQPAPRLRPGGGPVGVRRAQLAGARGGRRLLERLVDLVRELGYHKLVLAAFAFNRAGVALYERCGFREIGIYREQGMLDGRWVDTVVMERLL